MAGGDTTPERRDAPSRRIGVAEGWSLDEAGPK